MNGFTLETRYWYSVRELWIAAESWRSTWAARENARRWELRTKALALTCYHPADDNQDRGYTAMLPEQVAA